MPIVAPARTRSRRKGKVKTINGVFRVLLVVVLFIFFVLAQSRNLTLFPLTAYATISGALGLLNPDRRSVSGGRYFLAGLEVLRRLSKISQIYFLPAYV